VKVACAGALAGGRQAVSAPSAKRVVSVRVIVVDFIGVNMVGVSVS
jgi:hypothetical protein